jgi:hypothetical protein
MFLDLLKKVKDEVGAGALKGVLFKMAVSNSQIGMLAMTMPVGGKKAKAKANVKAVKEESRTGGARASGGVATAKRLNGSEPRLLNGETEVDNMAAAAASIQRTALHASFKTATNSLAGAGGFIAQEHSLDFFPCFYSGALSDRSCSVVYLRLVARSCLLPEEEQQSAIAPIGV